MIYERKVYQKRGFFAHIPQRMNKTELKEKGFGFADLPQHMDKTELIERIAKHANITNASAARALEAVVDIAKSMPAAARFLEAAIGVEKYTLKKNALVSTRTFTIKKLAGATTKRFRSGKSLAAATTGSHMTEPVAPVPEPGKRPPKKKRAINQLNRLEIENDQPL